MTDPILCERCMAPLGTNLIVLPYPYVADLRQRLMDIFNICVEAAKDPTFSHPAMSYVEAQIDKSAIEEIAALLRLPKPKPDEPEVPS